MTRFASPEHQALARLLCLSSAFNPEDGNAICDAFKALQWKERKDLTRFLNSDGIDQHPGYVLSDATSLLQNAKANGEVGITAALKMMLQVQVICTDGNWSASSKVIVNFGQLASWAEEAGSCQDFLEATVSVRSEVANDVRVATVEVRRPEGSSRAGASSSNSRGYTCELVTLLILCLSCLGLALCLFLDPGPVKKALPPDIAVQVLPHRYGAVAGVLSAFFLLFIIVRCRRRSGSSCCPGLSALLLNGGYSRLRQEDSLLLDQEDENV